MTARESHAIRARLRADRLAESFASEIREARLSLAKSQADCARLVGIDRAEWSRIEGRKRTGVPLELASRMASAVGLDMIVTYYPADRVVRDAAHLRLLADARALLGNEWDWRFEVPIGVPRDRRAWDAVGTHRLTGLSIRLEAETRLRDVQAMHRRIEAKRIADGEPRLALAIRASSSNRRAVVAAGDVLASAYPIDPRTALNKLRAGEDPGGNVMLLIDWQAARPAATPASAR
jgi:transcriptional regulator with XRE-family HTH domain